MLTKLFPVDGVFDLIAKNRKPLGGIDYGGGQVSGTHYGFELSEAPLSSSELDSQVVLRTKTEDVARGALLDVVHVPRGILAEATGMKAEAVIEFFWRDGGGAAKWGEKIPQSFHDGLR